MTARDRTDAATSDTDGSADERENTDERWPVSGSIVEDAAQPEGERGRMVVLEHDGRPAGQVKVESMGNRTIAELNEHVEGVAEDSQVVRCAFTGALHSAVPEWYMLNAKHLYTYLLGYERRWGVKVSTYHYPVERLVENEAGDLEGYRRGKLAEAEDEEVA